MAMVNGPNPNHDSFLLFVGAACGIVGMPTWNTRPESIFKVVEPIWPQIINVTDGRTTCRGNCAMRSMNKHHAVIKQEAQLLRSDPIQSNLYYAVDLMKFYSLISCVSTKI